jgi:hypothetical protein
MKRFTCLFLAACLLLICWGAPDARINPLKKDKLVSFTDERGRLGEAAQVPDEFYNVLNIGALWFPSISNKGYIGYSDISAYYPGGGDVSSVWQAGMYAGGYVEGNTNAWVYMGADGTHSDPAQYDNLHEDAIVEDETDYSLAYPYRRLTIHVNTATKPNMPEACVGNECTDGDLGMDVTYEWHQWGVPGYDHWVIIHVTIGFSKDIDDFWFGWFSDCDVGNVNLPDYYFDDYAGWDETYHFCYMRDWDYDALAPQLPAESTADSLWLTPNVVGQILLAAPPVAGGDISATPVSSQKWISKNFWDWNNDISSVQNAYDRVAGIWENPFPPEDDFDYRILNGVGPYDVSAGETGEFWVAYVIGEGYDEDSHATFDMGTLLEHVVDAQAFFDGGMVIPTSEYPPQIPDLNPDFAVDVSADELTVHWDPYINITGGAVADSFIVYTSRTSKMGPWERFAAFDNTATDMTIQLEPPGFYWYVWVQAYDDDNGIGSNPWALTSRLYEPDDEGIIRANENTIVGVIGSTPEESELDLITVAPNPYVGSNTGELDEYETLLGFHHLPGDCTIYIYNLLGNLVDILPHHSATGSEYWDMTTRSGESISSGLYIYRVTDENGNEKVGKFAVIKGQR